MPRILVLAGAVVVPVVLALVVWGLTRGGDEPTVATGAPPGDSAGPTAGNDGTDGTDTTDDTGADGTDVSCWDGTTAAEAAACPLPEGRAGMISVFPSIDDACTEGNADGGTMMSGKPELFECNQGDYTVRYSRWEEDFDRIGYLDSHSHGAQRSKWKVGGEVSGLRWVGGVDEKADRLKFRWQASYGDYPYDVLVKAVDESAMEEGIATIEAKPQSEIGLP